MLEVTVAESAALMAAKVAEILRVPQDDPFTPEWIAVPTAAMRRWLALELAGQLGAAGGAADGVAANIRFGFPGLVPRLVYEAGEGDRLEAAKRWRAEQLSWVLLAVLDEAAGDPLLGPITAAISAPLARARRVAARFGEYHLHRPDMVRAWSAGHDVDAAGTPLEAHQRWQPHLWRLARQRIDVPSPPESTPMHLDRLRAGELSVDLPQRVVVAGLSNLPGGEQYLDVLEALARHRDVSLVLLAPSAAAFGMGLQPPPRPLHGRRLRSDTEVALDGAGITLGRSWGRLHLEVATLLADHGIIPTLQTVRAGGTAGSDERRRSMLSQLQDSVRADRLSAVAVDADPSVQFHACHGLTRQVEVLRDALLHALADDPTLREDDIVVVCPDLPRVGPAIEAVFGPSAEWDHHPDDDQSTVPHLRYRVTDRSWRETNGVLAALDVILTAATGRFDAATVRDLLSLPPLRRRFGLGDDELGRIVEWVDAATIRWGLDGPAREPFGLPADLDAFSWQAGLDRLLVGSAVLSHPGSGEFAIGDLSPLDVEGSEVSLVGSLATIVDTLRSLARETHARKPIDEWIVLIDDLLDALFAVDLDDLWQLQAARQLLNVLRWDSSVDGKSSPVRLSFEDFRLLVTEHLDGAHGRPDFFRGGITVTSSWSMSWLPHRVVCFVGMDQGSLRQPPLDPDDLLAASASAGDRDPRSELRQSLLAMLLAAGDRVIVVRDGRNVVTNKDVPQATLVAELHDELRGLVGDANLETHHPRQAYDPRCFQPGVLATPGPWSFDAAAAAAAATPRATSLLPVPLLRRPLPSPCLGVITLDELRTALSHPIREFVRGTLGVSLPGDGDDVATLLPIEPTGLEQHAMGERLLAIRLGGSSIEDWVERERRRGSLPPGRFADTLTASLVGEVDQMIDAFHSHGGGSLDESHDIDLALADGVRLLGRVAPRRLMFQRPKPKHLIGAWIDLMALVASRPETPWRVLTVRRGESNGKPPTVEHLEASCRIEFGAEARRASALDVIGLAIDVYRRAMSEPIPLFPTLSRQIADGDPAPNGWESQRYGSGDRDDEWINLAFGAYDLTSLLAMPVSDHDPSGDSPWRVQRYAAWFWGAIDESTTAVTDTQGAA